MSEFSITIVAAIAAGVAGLVIAQVARLPSIVFLLILGVAMGPELAGLVEPDVFGDKLASLVKLAVAVILFEGGLSLNVARLRSAATGPIRNLLTVGALVTWIGAAVAARYIADLSWPVSLLFGSIVIVTGPTVIGPILRRIRVKTRLENILQWEGVLIDPIGVVIALVLLEYFLARNVGLAGTLGTFGYLMGVGAAVGIALGFVSGMVLRSPRVLPPEEEHAGNLFALAMAILAYGLGEAIHEEAGIVAATTLGFVLGNLNIHNIEDLKRFGGQVSQLVVALLFVVLAANIEFAKLEAVRAPLFLVVAVLIFIVRPLNIFVSTIGSGLGFREKLFLSWISPRGIVAASVASLFAVTLPEEVYPGSVLIEPLVFLTISITVLLQGFSAGFVSRILGVAEPERRGYLLIGAHALGISLGRALSAQEIPIVLVDSNLSNCIRARRQGLYVSKGNAMDTRFLERAMTPETGQVVALTVNDEVNALASISARSLVGSEKIWRVVNEEQSDVAPEKSGAVGAGKIAFGEPFDVDRVCAQIEAGEWEVDVYVAERSMLLGGNPAELKDEPYPLMRLNGRRAEVLASGDRIEEGEHTLALVPKRKAGTTSPA